MTVITSPHNPQLKRLRRLHRARERARTGLFVAEGEDLIACARQAGREAVEGFFACARQAGREAVEGFCVPGADRRVSAAGEHDALARAGFHEVQAAALAAVSTLGSGTRVIAVYEQQWTAPTGPLCVYLHGVKDPGNVGTVLRSAHAFGASCVALGPGCADPHSPKAVRASMGAIFFVPLARVERLDELPGDRLALVAGPGEPLWNAVHDIFEKDPRARVRARARRLACDESPNPADEPSHGAVTLLVGSERDGLPQEVVGECERVAHIPIRGDSLNAAMAATAALYEMTRPSIRVHP